MKKDQYIKTILTSSAFMMIGVYVDAGTMVPVKSVVPMVKPVGAPVVKPVVAAPVVKPVAPIAMDEKKAQFIFKSSFGKPMFGGKCADDFGKINWNGVKQLVDGGKGALVDQHIKTNVLPCLVPTEVTKHPNFTKALSGSCSMGTAVVGMPLKDQVCNSVKAGASAIGQNKDDASLFPSMMSNVGCQAGKAAPFDAVKLAGFVARQEAVLASNVPVVQKTEAMNNVKKAQNYVADLYKCAQSKSDPNFNKAISVKFEAVDNTCPAPANFPKVASRIEKLNNVPFINAIFGPNSLCTFTKATSVNIADSKEVAIAKKGLGVPMIPMTTKINPAGYAGFRVGLVTPLTLPTAPGYIATWLAKDPVGFNAHFGKILQNVTVVNGKTTNPNATETVVSACSGVLAANTTPIIQQICTNANATKVQNGNNVQVAAAKKALGVPAVALQYKSCSETFGQKLDAIQLSTWVQFDSVGASKHLDEINKCFSDGKPHPKLSSTVKQACDAGVSQVAEAATLCAAATAKEAENTNAMMASVGMDPNAGAVDPSIDPTTGLPVDSNAAVVDPSIDPETGLPIDPNAAAVDPSIDPTTGLPVDPNAAAVDPSIDPNTGVDPSIDPTTGLPIDSSENFDGAANLVTGS